MSEWITDRRPCESDADIHGYVWVTDTDGDVRHMMWDCVTDEPWMPFNRPEPYVKPKRYVVKSMHELEFDSHPVSGFCVWSTRGGVGAYSIPTREAAERIAAIYEEVMP